MSHGGNIFEIERQIGVEGKSLLDFSANINPLGVPKSLKKIMLEAFDDLVNYPDINYFDLKSAIGEKYMVSKDDVYVGNGGVQVIFDFIKAINPRNSIVVYPTFIEYERALRATGSEVKEFFLKEESDFLLSIDALIEEIHEGIDMVVLCNPNNPTGRLVEKDKLVKLLKKCQKNKVFLMVDEAFMDFVEEGEAQSLLILSMNYDNLLVTRSFTKFYGIPGLRLGFGVCSHPMVKERLKEIAIPWTVNTFASYFGRVLLEEKEYEIRTHQWLKKESVRFVEELRKLNLFKIYPPSVNYILMKILPEDLELVDLRKFLLQEKILIRDCSNFKGLSNRFVRIAIKDTRANDTLLEALKRR